MIFSEHRGGTRAAAVARQSASSPDDGTGGVAASAVGYLSWVYFFVKPPDIFLTPRVHEYFRA